MAGLRVSDGDDTAEGLDIRPAGMTEGPKLDKEVSPVSVFEEKPYWGVHFWAKGYCDDTVGLDADMIRKYVRYQEKNEQEIEQLQLCD